MIGLLASTTAGVARLATTAPHCSSSSNRHVAVRCFAPSRSRSAPRLAARSGGGAVGRSRRCLVEPMTATGGNGGGWGGRGGGGGGQNEHDDDDEDGTDGSSAWKAAGLALPALALLTHHALAPPHAHAGKGSSASLFQPKGSSAVDPKDVGVCFVYGFSWWGRYKLTLNPKP
jgi:hypothetical protein